MTVSEVIRTTFPTLMSVPRWSPDRTKLVLSVEDLTEDADYDLGSAIAVVDASGGSLQLLTDPDLFAY